MTYRADDRQADAAARQAGRPAPTAPRIAIQGYPGAFHEIAARCFFEGTEPEVLPADTFREVVQLIERGTADAGLMAIENTLAGSIMHNYELLRESSLRIVGEVYLRIRQNLLAFPGSTLNDLQEVHSHPMALAQCAEFFRQHPHIRLVETVDTALSARHIRENGWKHIGAVASSLAAERYGLHVLAPSIETHKQNHTRFLVLGRQPARRPPTEEKVSICFSLDHEVGSLYKVLAVLAAYQVNLTKIQSAPIVGRHWEYRFYIDFVLEGKVSWEQALEAIQPLTHELKVMGVYEKGKHHEG
ncbi:MAG: prephenate dehydratase [Bacteroidetes bacterium]|nr:MAG: prephenate dehydratase [Bacteroidota bacterium]